MIELLIIHFLFAPFNPYNGFGTTPIINGTYYNISTMSGFFQATNASSAGLEQLFILLVVFFCLWGGATLVGRFNPVMSALGASVIMTPISVLAQIVFASSGGAIGSFMPLAFIGIAVLAAMVGLLGGFRSPYG